MPRVQGLGLTAGLLFRKRPMPQAGLAQVSHLERLV